MFIYFQVISTHSVHVHTCTFFNIEPMNQVSAHHECPSGMDMPRAHWSIGQWIQSVEKNQINLSTYRLNRDWCFLPFSWLRHVPDAFHLILIAVIIFLSREQNFLASNNNWIISENIWQKHHQLKWHTSFFFWMKLENNITHFFLAVKTSFIFYFYTYTSIFSTLTWLVCFFSTLYNLQTSNG